MKSTVSVQFSKSIFYFSFLYDTIFNVLISEMTLKKWIDEEHHVENCS